MTDMTDKDIEQALEVADGQPLDYIHFLIFDHGEQQEPFEAWVDMDGGFQTNAIELVDDDDEIPEPIQQCADILLDLHDGYKITHVEYKVEEYDGSPCFFVQVFAVPLEDDEETNLTDDVFNKFYQIIMNAKQEVIEG